MIHPLVRDLAADGVPVVVTCQVLGFTPQAYHKWKANPVSAREWDDAHLVDAARAVHADDPTFGYRFITDELAAEHGIKASENRVHRLCSSHGIFSVLAKRRRRWVRPGPAVHDDLVRREFTAARPNELWLTDITEHRTDEGKLYLCAIKDACSGRIVGYSIDERMKASLAVAALRNATALRRCRGTVVHSDRGSQFRSAKYVRALRGAGLLGSMGRTGSCADNAAIPEDLVEREFSAERPNQLWVADLTYVRTHSGFVYVAFIVDVFSRFIVGWQASRSLHAELALDALEMAIWSRQDLNGLIHHSDRGSQYLAIRYTERLGEMGVVASVGSKGDSYDNALAETINGLYKTEVIYRRRGGWKGIDDVSFSTLEWVDWFNHRRLLEPIGDVPPAEFEAAYYTKEGTKQTEGLREPSLR